jgi:Protein of unknown function (DUF3048) N-terminal domain/Protein of unknown function (DUF3048) C-terminal domain
MFSTSRGIRVITAVLAVNLVGGCAAVAVTNNGTGSNPSSSASAASVTAPLTGVSYPAGTNNFLAGPVVMGKIDNSPEARPQEGLNSTDVVFDEMVEGGLTRFLAVWHSKLPAEFGPIRSVRPMDPDLATAFGGIISYSGGQIPFVNAMRATGLYNADETSEVGKNTMVRVTNRVAPHNLFVKAQNLQALHLPLGAPKPFLSFASDSTHANLVSPATSGTPVASVKAQFPAATALWTWQDGLWRRTQDGKALTDAADGKQITAVNVVVLRVAIDRSFRDPRYGFVPKTLLEGTGKGTVFSGGKSLDVIWTKSTQAGYVKLTDTKGQTVSLLPGNTWFELVPSDVGKVTVTAALGQAATPTPKK